MGCVGDSFWRCGAAAGHVRAVTQDGRVQQQVSLGGVRVWGGCTSATKPDHIPGRLHAQGGCSLDADRFERELLAPTSSVWHATALTAQRQGAPHLLTTGTATMSRSTGICLIFSTW